MYLGTVSQNSGASEKYSEPNWMVWQAEGEASRERANIGPPVGIETFPDY